MLSSNLLIKERKQAWKMIHTDNMMKTVIIPAQAKKSPKEYFCTISIGCLYLYIVRAISNK